MDNINSTGETRTSINAGGATGEEAKVAIWVNFEEYWDPKHEPRVVSRTVLLNKKDALRLAMKIIEEAAR